MQRTSHKNVPLYQFEMWQDAPFRHGVFTRNGGVSKAPFDTLNLGGTVGDDLQAVAQNHQILYDSLGLDPSRACTVWQVHGADTVLVSHPPQKRLWANRADAMITNQKGLALLMRFADCVPIMFYDPQHHAVGFAHAGWRGTLAGAQVSTVKPMQQAFDTDPSALQAGIGPSIGPDHYQVGEEVVEQVQAAFGTTDGLVTRASDGSAYFNLWEANRRKLREAGVRHIETSELCTATHTDEFFSHRAERGSTGRFGAVIAL